MVPRQNGFHRMAFPATRGTIQGGLVSPTLFNVVVGNVITTWLTITVKYHRVYHDSLGDTVGPGLGVFYADDSMVGSQDPDWLQHLMNVMVGLKSVWPCGQRFQVTYDDVTTRHTTVGDVRVGQCSELHRGGILVLGETQKKDPMPRVCSGSHRRFNDDTSPTH